MTIKEMELRALVIAPTGRDGELISNLLASHGIPCELFATSEAARMEARAGAGVVIMAEEAMHLPDIDMWASQIGEQPSWSELFFLLLTVPGERSRKRMLAQQPLGNMVLLERPVRPETLISTVRVALRSRRRQYEMRDQLAATRLAEIALRKSEKLVVAGRLALSISHEINNPLAAVTNLLYLIGTSSSLPDAKALNEIAARELARVAEIVAQTLRFYRDPGKPTVVHIDEIVDSALTLYRSKIASAEIAIERDFRECSPIVAMSGEVRQMTLNLIGNAIDALGHHGRLKIRAANARQHSNGSLRGIRLTIADTGSGIPPEIRDSLFEPFVSTKGDTGTGLGLWLSSQIVHKHGGTIQVKSRALPPDSGTVFSVFLPLELQSG
ncbi:MAG TPA: ATP-binding protein, partial [Terracidiphilus sp.]|nr:ATP-binding protein [Terracidiphilus sp.]